MERKWGLPPDGPADAEARLASHTDPGPEEARRLQRMGAVTMGVSLPRDWVGEHRLGVGSPVFLQSLSDGSIVVRDRPILDRPKIAEILVRVDRPREHLFRRLVAAYLDGAHEFHVREPGGLSAETRSTARTFVRRTIQPEIVSEEGDLLVLKDVSRGSDLDLVPLLRRMHQVVQRLHEEAATAFDGHATASEDEFPRRDDEVDRHAWLLERLLSFRAASPGAARPGAFGGVTQVLLVVRSLERTADHAVLIAEHGARWAETSPPARMVRPVTEFHAQARRLLADAFAAAEAGDADAANDLLDTGEALHREHRTLVESMLTRRGGPSLPDAGTVELALLLESVDRTAAYAQDIAEAGLDSGVRSQLTVSSRIPSHSSPYSERGGSRRK